MSDPTEDFSHMWGWFSTHCEATSPLYAHISSAIAGDREILAFVRAAPPAAHLPPALLAAAHYLVLAGTDHPLAAVYAGRSEADPERSSSTSSAPIEKRSAPYSPSAIFRRTNAAVVR